MVLITEKAVYISYTNKFGIKKAVLLNQKTIPQ